MRMKIVAASLLALGMATSAFAQNTPAPTTPTAPAMNNSTGGSGGGTGTMHKAKPHHMKTASTKKVHCQGGTTKCVPTSG